jgi:hypothetical protein
MDELARRRRRRRGGGGGGGGGGGCPRTRSGLWRNFRAPANPSAAAAPAGRSWLFPAWPWTWCCFFLSPIVPRLQVRDQGDQIGRFFTLGSFILNKEVAQLFWATFYYVSSYALILTKNRMGYILADFFIRKRIWSPCWRLPTWFTFRMSLPCRYVQLAGYMWQLGAMDLAHVRLDGRLVEEMQETFRP